MKVYILMEYNYKTRETNHIGVMKCQNKAEDWFQNNVINRSYKEVDLIDEINCEEDN